MRAVVVGTGRMGRSVQAALDARGHSIAAMVGSLENAGGAALVPARLTGVLVRTGKFTPASLELGEPDHVIDSLGDLSALLRG